MTSHVRTVLSTAAVGLLAGLLAACGEDSDADNAAGSDSGGTTTLEFGFTSESPSGALVPILAAQELGYLEEEGVELNINYIGGSGPTLEQLAAGNIDIGIPSLSSTVEAKAAGLDVVEIFTSQTGSTYGIFAPPGGEVGSVEDLAGRNVGNTEVGGGEVSILNAALRDVGLDPLTDINLIPIGSGDATTIDALESGEVDAYTSSYNDTFAMAAAGYQLEDITPEQFHEFPNRGLVTTPDKLEEFRDAFVGLGRAHAKAHLFCSVNSDACAEFMKAAAPEQWAETETGLTQGQMNHDLIVSTAVLADGDQLAGRHDPAAVDALIEMIAESAEGFEVFPSTDLMNTDLLEEINDFDQEAIIAEAENYGS